MKDYEYSSSKNIFTSFLQNREPFSSVFNNGLAADFYSSNRCGLLHEATTKNGWRIWGKSESGNEIVCPKSQKVFRDDLQTAPKIYMKGYGNELVYSKERQQAFIRKFNSLCE